LTFDGVGFLFDIPSQYHGMYSDGTHLPVSLLDGSSPLLKRIYIYSASRTPSDSSDKHSDPYPSTSSITLSCHSKPEVELSSLHHQHQQRNEGYAREKQVLFVGMSLQDVVSSIGMPEFASQPSARSESYVQKYEYRKLGNSSRRVYKLSNRWIILCICLYKYLFIDKFFMNVYKV
jgi:hypothetical protein